MIIISVLATLIGWFIVECWIIDYDLREKQREENEWKEYEFELRKIEW